ncbi:K(+)-transporting ATPase subunit F [Clostridium magnum]
MEELKMSGLIIITILLFVYLCYALFNPEKF